MKHDAIVGQGYEAYIVLHTAPSRLTNDTVAFPYTSESSYLKT